MSDSMLVIPKRIWKQQQRDFRREMSESMVDVIALTTRGCCSDLKKGLAIAELDEEYKDDVSNNHDLRQPEKQPAIAVIAAITTASANKRKADDEWHNNDGSSYYYDDQKCEHKKNGIVSPSNKKRIES